MLLHIHTCSIPLVAFVFPILFSINVHSGSFGGINSRGRGPNSYIISRYFLRTTDDARLVQNSQRLGSTDKIMLLVRGKRTIWYFPVMFLLDLPASATTGLKEFTYFRRDSSLCEPHSGTFLPPALAMLLKFQEEILPPWLESKNPTCL